MNYTKGSQERKDLIKLCTDTIKGVTMDFDKRVNSSVANEAIRQAFVDLVGTDKFDYKTMRRNNNLATAFEIIEEVVDIRLEEGFRNNPFFKQFVEFKNTAIGDRPEFYVENMNSIVVSEISGNHWNLNRQRLNRGETFLIPTRWYGVKVFEEFERMLSGRIDFVDLINKIEEAVTEKMSETVAKEFMGSFDVIPTEFTHSGNFDLQELIKIVNKVKAANPKSQITIVGTRTALDNIPDAYGQSASFLISEKMKDQINNTGVLQTWRGHKILEIPQNFIQGTFDYGVDDNIIYIMTGEEKPIKVVKEGESIIREENSGLGNQDMTAEYSFMTKYGIGVILNKYYGAYKVIV